MPSQSVCPWSSRLSIVESSNQFGDDTGLVNIGQSLVPSVVGVGQLFMIEAELMKDRGMMVEKKLQQHFVEKLLWPKMEEK